jgi:hypothetical protein
MPVEVRHREGERMVDADEGGDFAVEFLAEPFSETPARLVPPRAG